ncbi:MAG: hypothetical protein HY695_29430 [Deltaproteobacteria bacterium]|nr:hypothetical protein [Deltaproteobacteria bacterium]
MTRIENRSLLLSGGDGAGGGALPATPLTVEEKALALFQPDILLSAEYFRTLQRRLQLEPEEKLMFAILEDAVACFQKHLLTQNTRGKNLFREVEEWILAKDARWVFSFENICEVLGFDPGFLREGLIKWKSRQLRAHARPRVISLNVNHKSKKPLRNPAAGPQKLLKAAAY